MQHDRDHIYEKPTADIQVYLQYTHDFIQAIMRKDDQSHKDWLLLNLHTMPFDLNYGGCGGLMYNPFDQGIDRIRTYRGSESWTRKSVQIPYFDEAVDPKKMRAKQYQGDMEFFIKDINELETSTDLSYLPEHRQIQEERVKTLKKWLLDNIHNMPYDEDYEFFFHYNPDTAEPYDQGLDRIYSVWKSGMMEW